MFILDDALVGGLRFVLRQLARAADAELNDPSALRARLVEAQYRLEAGEIDENAFRGVERDVLARLRELRRTAEDDEAEEGAVRVTGVEATFTGDEH
jgi:hypothetical protein